MSKNIDRRLADMEYNNDGMSRCLAVGVYRGFQYAVFNIRGVNPCGYVNILGHENELIDDPEATYDWEHFNWLDCHGGVTYAEAGLGSFAGGYWIGWDYAHYNDYVSFAGDVFGRRYCTGEIVLECKNVINQICERLGVAHG